MGSHVQKEQATSLIGKLRVSYPNRLLMFATIWTVLTVPVGFMIPMYLLYKIRSNTANELSPFEGYTAIIWPGIGMAVVELFGRRGAVGIWMLALLAALIGSAALVALLGP